MPAPGALAYESGAWEINLAQRELRLRGKPIPLGGRAFDIIEVLIQSAGQLVTKGDLMSRVWPDVTVGDNTLQVHVWAVRKALGADRWMLKTTSGRGYRLLGDWGRQKKSTAAITAAPARTEVRSPQTNLPAAGADLIGRDAVVRRLRDLLTAYRIVTLTGPGGIGKTALALEVGRGVIDEFADGCWLVELASLSDPGLVPSAVAQVLRLGLGGGDITAETVARAINDRHLLLVLDNCEHVIDAVAILAEMLLRVCSRVTILATSREVLRSHGEQVYRVPPLVVPAPGEDEASEILGHSAPELFIARARELGSDFLPNATNLATIAAICRHLDGIPLAIEFAAARAATLGIAEVLARLDDRFALLTSGRRTALPKHRTLRATLNWSYELLSGPERQLLQRLAIFAAAFSLEAAGVVVANSEGPPSDISDGIANLVAKSLVSADSAGAEVHFRLLETTRVYALEKLTEAGELPQLARRHAEHYRRLFETFEEGWETRSARLADLGNVRAALEWCFGLDGDVEIGIGLAATVAPVFLAMSLLPECHRWSERALLALDHAARGGREEMRLQAALGMSLMLMRGENEAVLTALATSLAIAEARGDAFAQLKLLGPLRMFHSRIANIKVAVHYAKRASAVAETIGDPAASTLAHAMLGGALYFAGDLGGARTELEAALEGRSGSQPTRTTYFGFGGHDIAAVTLAMTLWLLGYPAQAEERARRTIEHAAVTDHPVTLSVVLIWGICLFLWLGDLKNAERHIDWFISRAESYSLRPYLAVGRGFKGQLAILRGDAKFGVESLRGCLADLHAVRYELLTTPFKISLAQGLAAIGRCADGVMLIDETIRTVETNGEHCYLPELLRVKGTILLTMPRPDRDYAEICFRRSFDAGRRQGARSLQLRAAVDLAALLTARGQVASAQELLRPVFEQFSEGLNTADLMAAERLLATLS